MISKIKTLLLLVSLIAFLSSATLVFASSIGLVAGNDNSVILMNDDDDKDKDDDDDDDDDDKHK